MTTKTLSLLTFVLAAGLGTQASAGGQEVGRQTEVWGASILGTLRPPTIANFEISAPGQRWLVVAVQFSPPKNQKELRFSEIEIVDKSGLRYPAVSFGLARMTLSGPRIWDTTMDPQFATTREEFKKAVKLDLGNGQPPPLVLLFEIGGAADGLVLQVAKASKFPLQ